ncbi:MAG: ABC transporter ATP-binding protein [Polyangiaceae bacterium]
MTNETAGICGPSSRPLSALLRSSWRFVAPQRLGLFAAACMAVFTAALAAYEPLALKWIFDELAGGRSLRRLVLFGAGLLAVLSCKELLSVALDRTTWRIRLATHESVTRAVVEHLHALPLSYHRRESVGGISTKMDRGINGAVAAFSEIAFQTLPTVAYLVLSAVVMFRLDWRMALLVCVFVPLPPIVGARAVGEQRLRERWLMDRWTRLFSRLGEVLSGIAVVKSFAMEEVEKARILGGVREANQVVLRGVMTDSRTAAKKNLSVSLARMSAIGLGTWFVVRGQLSLGSLVALLGYLGGLFGPVQGLTGMLQTMHRGAVGLETIFEILDEEDSPTDAPDAVDLLHVRGEVEFRGVVFAYKPGQPIVRGVDLRASPGETLALVGPSGAGKTTLMALLQRLYDVTAGQVLIDGVDVRQLRTRTLREHIGVVLQDVTLFSDTARDNIRVGRPDADFDAVERAARAAHAHEFIVKLARGYDTPLGERGALLSAGQRQRIAIARALLKSPAILVLDEATSALDAESEELVQDALARLKRGRTTFVVAHRLTTVTGADRILVLRDGRITEIGSHAELVARDGHYASLVRRQVRGLLVDAA